MIVLGAKTDYSFQRGFGTGAQWRARCEELGVTALGLADYCSTWSHAPFRDAFKGSGIRLLYGVQVPVVAYLDKDPRHSLVTLYAKSNLSQLYKLMTLAHEQTFYRPRLTWKQVKEADDVFVVVNALLRSHVSIVKGLDGAMIGDDGEVPDFVTKVSRPRVIDYSPRFPSPDDRQGFEILMRNSSGARMGEIEIKPSHMLRLGELSRRYTAPQGQEHAINARLLAEACVADIPKASLLPYDIKDKRDALERMAYEGIAKVGLSATDWRTKGYKERLANELDVIAAKGFEDYFFFVHEICEWADQRMLIGPGRGSAGGSLLCYLLGITHVDPLRFSTLFERFIDVTRSDLPDIDIDFPDTRREEVFEFMKTRFGSERFARLGTLTELGGKSAFNAVARATDVPFEISREFGKWTEGDVQGKVIDCSWVLDNVEELKGLLEKYPSMALAKNVEGHATHHGVHASGVVVAPEAVSNYAVVDRAGVMAMDMKTAEAQGFVKMDVLGLKTLSVIQECCDLAGINPKTLRSLDWNNLEVLDGIFNKDRVTGVFQFSGRTVRDLMKQVKVDKFDDLCALTSLARPGPLIGGAAAGWVKARNGGDARASIHPALDVTYGTLTYQEQMMAVCRDIAMFDVADVNGMRRAVAKKDPIKLASYREKFIAGCQRDGIGNARPQKDQGIPGESKSRNVGAEADDITPSQRGCREDSRAQGKGELCVGGASVAGRGPAREEASSFRSGSSYGSVQDEQQSAQSFSHKRVFSPTPSQCDASGPQLVADQMAVEPGSWVRVPLSADRSAELWEELNEFGYYAFNFSHAVAYGMLSFMTAWLKLKHPLEFAVAQLKYAADEDEAKNLLRELIEEGYQYVPFDAARSGATWSVSNSQLVGGFDSIRGIGEKTAARLAALRDADPDFWLEELTDSMRQKVLGARTPWSNLSYFTDKFRELYADPGAFRCATAPKGIRPPVYRIRDIPEDKGSYAFLGRIIMRKHVDDNEPARVEKRGGKKRVKDTHFINLTIEDDTGEIGATINRMKARDYLWLIEEDLSGRDFLFRGNVIEQGRKWLFIDKVLEIK